MQLIFSTPNRLAIASIRERSLRQSGCCFPSFAHIARYSPNRSCNTVMEAGGLGIGFSYISSLIGRGSGQLTLRRALHLPISVRAALLCYRPVQRYPHSSRPTNVRSLRRRFAVPKSFRSLSFLTSCCGAGMIAHRALRDVNDVVLGRRHWGRFSHGI